MEGSTVYDLVYRPVMTKLLENARAKGATIIYGYEMLLEQGAQAFEIWTGIKAPILAMKKDSLWGISRAKMTRLIRSTIHGAVSVVNAVANGRGSALGISLKVVADLSISAGKGIYLQSKQGEKLLNILVRRTLPKTVILDNAVRIEIKSEIPVGFGLKSQAQCQVQLHWPFRNSSVMISMM